MYLSDIRIENFRLFGVGKDAFELSLKPGLTAIVGENDAGKTAIVDALRFVLATQDQESMRLDFTDFHYAPNGERANEITIRIIFSGLTPGDRSAFAEYLTYSTDTCSETILVITLSARRTETDGPVRRFMPVEWRTGVNADGPLLDAGARFLLQITYLRPLRDAERAMSAGRGSRLSQILQHTKEIKEHGVKFNPEANPSPDPNTLSVLGIGDYASHLIENAHGIKATRTKLNEEYLHPLSFSGDMLEARVRISGNRDDNTRLRQLLEKLEVNLGANDLLEGTYPRGLGSNNILFMACELLLMGTEADSFPLLIVEEPEAHLHPQRQLRLMTFLQEQASKKRTDGQYIQMIITTHSPNLASDVRLDNLVLVRDGKGFSMAEGQTKLTKSDYRFLQRFLDVTKANLFFSRGVVIVEGSAESILLPAIARLIDRDFESYGVSVVNVGGIGLSRYGRIFMREKPDVDGQISIPVACITDIDVMPDCAAVILGKIKDGENAPSLSKSKRRWRIKSDFKGDELDQKRAQIRDKANEQNVKTFVSSEWTLEYDLSYFGLAKEMFIARKLAEAEDKITSGKVTEFEVKIRAFNEYAVLTAKFSAREELCCHIYKSFVESNSISKPTAAQYLADILETKFKNKILTQQDLRNRLPSYLLDAIVHVTKPFDLVAEFSAHDVAPPTGAPELNPNHDMGAEHHV